MLHFKETQPDMPVGGLESLSAILASKEKLTPPFQQKLIIDPANPPLIHPLDGYRTEFGSSNFNIDNRALIEVEKHSPFYRNNFEGQRTYKSYFYQNFIVLRRNELTEP
jgi:hypothetical protein